MNIETAKQFLKETHTGLNSLEYLASLLEAYRKYCEKKDTELE